MKLQVIANTQRYEIDDSYDPDDEWDRPDTETILTGFKVTPGDGYDWYQDGPFDIDVNIGDVVYIVYSQYNTGDTFGRDNGYVHVHDVFKDKIEAESLKATLLKISCPSGDKIVPFNVKHSRKNYRVPWAGYFEDHSDTDIYEVVVTNV